MHRYNNKKYLHYLLLCLINVACTKNSKTTNQWSLPNVAFNELIELCDTSTLTTYEEFYNRIDRIQNIFVEHNDKRGAFPTVYKAITQVAVITLRDDAYDEAQKLYDFSMDFSKRYLYYLKHHLLNDEPLEYHWDLYYEHCRKNYNTTRLVLEGINAHITLDLTRSLAEVKIQEENRDDWLFFGERVVLAVPGFLEELQNEYHTDASGIFGVFFLGDIIDAFLGDGYAITFGFNLLRIEAFNFALALQQPQIEQQTEINMRKSFFLKEDLFQLLDDAKLTP